MTVVAANNWRSNADLIEDISKLGYITDDSSVIDLTFGRGKWWVKYTPKNLTGLTNLTREYLLEHSNLDVNVITDADYTNLVGIADNSYDVCIFDPPYVALGGRDTSTMPDFMDRYGLYDAPRNPKELHKYNIKGLAEAVRITKPAGYIMVKCAPYIWSGRRQEADIWMREEAMRLGLEVQDLFIHIGVLRAQPKRDRQLHSRNNYSVLFVFKKPKEKLTRRKNNE